jgi:hypothetical protein
MRLWTQLICPIDEFATPMRWRLVWSETATKKLFCGKEILENLTLFFKSDVLSSFAPSGSQSRGSTTLTSPLEVRSRHR